MWFFLKMLFRFTKSVRFCVRRVIFSCFVPLLVQIYNRSFWLNLKYISRHFSLPGLCEADSWWHRAEASIRSISTLWINMSDSWKLLWKSALSLSIAFSHSLPCHWEGLIYSLIHHMIVNFKKKFFEGGGVKRWGTVLSTDVFGFPSGWWMGHGGVSGWFVSSPVLSPSSSD